jgi:hypothetical protein
MSSSTPSALNALKAFGGICMPAPISRISGACSRICDAYPLRESAKAVATPPMPPPTMMIGKV